MHQPTDAKAAAAGACGCHDACDNVSRPTAAGMQCWTTTAISCSNQPKHLTQVHVWAWAQKQLPCRSMRVVACINCFCVSMDTLARPHRPPPYLDPADPHRDRADVESSDEQEGQHHLCTPGACGHGKPSLLEAIFSAADPFRIEAFIADKIITLESQPS